MKNTALHLLTLICLALPILPGCGGSNPDKPAAGIQEGEGSGEAAKDGIKKYDITDLPPVDEPLPRPLDGNRLEICPPADWKFSSQANYLVVFAKGKVSELPRMTVAGVDSPFGKDDTTEENAQALAKNIQKKLEKDGRNIREKAKPIKLGELVWVRHVRQSSQGGTPCAVQSLQIVRDGRLYSLEAFSAAKDDSPASMANAVKGIRDMAYAVAANAKFVKESGGSPSAPPAEEKPPETKEEGKPATPPAAEKPADPKPEEKKTG
ncbi:MAG: hypothetical protein ACKVP0_22935 [Pirellulaceae bacterium]